MGNIAKDALNVFSSMLVDDQKARPDRINDVGERIMEQFKLDYMTAVNRHGQAENRFYSEVDRYDKINNSLKSLGSNATKTQIAEQLALNDGVSWSELSNEDSRNKIIEFYSGQVEENEKGQYVYKGLSEPVAPKWGEFFDQTKYNEAMVKAEDLQGPLTERIRGWLGKENASETKILAALQDDLSTGNNNALDKLKEYREIPTEWSWNKTPEEVESTIEGFNLNSKEVKENFTAFIDSVPGLDETWNKWLAWQMPGMSAEKDYANIREIMLRSLNMPQEELDALFEYDKEQLSMGKKVVIGMSPLGMEYYKQVLPLMKNSFDALYTQIYLAPTLTPDSALETFQSLATGNAVKDMTIQHINRRTVRFEVDNFKFWADSFKVRPIIIPQNVIDNKSLEKLHDTLVTVQEDGKISLATQEDIDAGIAVVSAFSALQNELEIDLAAKWQKENRAKIWDPINYGDVSNAFNNMMAVASSNLLTDLFSKSKEEEQAPLVEEEEAPLVEEEQPLLVEEEQAPLVEEEEIIPEEQVINSTSIPKLVKQNADGSIVVSIDGKKQTIPADTPMYIDEDKDGTYKKYSYNSNTKKIGSPWMGVGQNWDTLTELSGIGLLSNKFIETFNNKKVSVNDINATKFKDGTKTIDINQEFNTVEGDTYKPVVVENTNEYGYKVYSIELQKVTDNTPDQTAKSILSTNLSNFDIA